MKVGVELVIGGKGKVEHLGLRLLWLLLCFRGGLIGNRRRTTSSLEQKN
jgi:hypothetical protein